MDTGYIKLFRKMTEWAWYDDLPTFKLFIHLLLKVNYKDSEWKGIMIERGCCVTSIPKLATETGLTPKQIRRAIDVLIRADNVAKSSTSKYTIIKVLNYDLYQANDIVEGRQKADKGQTKGTQEGSQRATSKEEKEIKNIKNIKEENKQRRKDDNSSVDEIKRIVEYLNLKTGKSFKHTTQNTKSHIQARIADGYAFDDFKKVIDKKVLDWGNSEKMKNYLRPSTLFAPTNFENYLNEGEVARDEGNTGNAWYGITSL